MASKKKDSDKEIVGRFHFFYAGYVPMGHHDLKEMPAIDSTIKLGLLGQLYTIKKIQDNGNNDYSVTVVYAEEVEKK